MRFHYRPGHDAYPKLFCQLCISVQVIIPLLAQGEELRVFRRPVREMVFGEDGKVGAFCGGVSYEVDGSGEVVGGI